MDIKKTKKYIIPGISIALLLGLLISTLSMLYSISLFKNIETPIRICVALIITDLVGIFSIIGYKLLAKRKKKILISFFVILAIYVLGLSFGSYKVNQIYSKLATISNGKYDNYSTSIVVANKSSYKEIQDIKNKKVGIFDEDDKIEWYEIPMKIVEDEKISKKNIIMYDNYIEMIDDLLEEKIDAIFLPTNYTIMFSSKDGYENIAETTRIIYTKEVKKESDEEFLEQTDLTKSFTILVMGVDTTGNGLSTSFNGDALILITFNPTTLNTTILSVPRDTYMPISCMSDRSNKITNAGWYGETCIINSLENYFDINIDYYAKINFKGVVSLVDAIGGVEVDVPYSFCEQDSNRKWGKNTVFVNSGKQLLNGEQALAFARHRKVTSYMRSYCGDKYTQNAGYWNDFVRGQNQQVIIRAILDKLAKEVKNFSTIEDLLNTISDNAKTNMSTTTILSLYNLGKDILSKTSNSEQTLNMQRLYLTGYDSYIYDYSYLHNKGTKLNLYNYVVYDDSLSDVVDTMKANLGLKKYTARKTFSFSIKNEYEETVIGKGHYSKTSLVKMPNLIGRNISYAQNFADNNNINLIIHYVEGTPGQTIGQIVSQSAPELTDLAYLTNTKTITINVINSIPYQPPVDEEIDPIEEPTI
jgi:cell envelope-related function transcriptional attenuator common domain